MSALGMLFDKYADLSPEDPHWICDGVGDEGSDFCRKCALAKIKADGKGQLSMSVAPESDSCLHCSVCGKLLDYTLTGSGADAELAHFRSVKFRRDKPLDRDTAYHLARMLWGKDGDLEAVTIAARAIRCMKKIPTLNG
jgi:hypothetical protein